MGKDNIDKANLSKTDNNSTQLEKENDDQLVEMAAEQIAGLLWRQWLYMRGLENKPPGSTSSNKFKLK
jgi:hypothetical protein